jgi:hypothetical protein
MVSPAGYLREVTERGIKSPQDIVRKYASWVLEDRYIILAHERKLGFLTLGNTSIWRLSVLNMGMTFTCASIGASLLDFDVEIWTVKLNSEQMQRIFNEWE